MPSLRHDPNRFKNLRGTANLSVGIKIIIQFQSPLRFKNPLTRTDFVKLKVKNIFVFRLNPGLSPILYTPIFVFIFDCYYKLIITS